jgi:hypothetical protein
MHPSEYFGYLKDHETRLCKHQIRKEKHELKVQTFLIQLRSMINDKVLKGLRREMMLRDVKILYEVIKQKYGLGRANDYQQRIRSADQGEVRGL